jgi:hypothetical protein
MKNDTTTTILNFVLAALVILGVLFALLGIWKLRDLRRVQPQVQMQVQQFQVVSAKVQALLQDVAIYNGTARSPELEQLLQSVKAPAPAAK